jgi:hypothetical protein
MELLVKRAMDWLPNVAVDLEAKEADNVDSFGPTDEEGEQQEELVLVPVEADLDTRRPFV